MSVRPDIRYRIQNVDFGTYLERRGKASLYLRANKDGNKRQQWYFVENKKGSGVYEIQNADDTSYCISSTTSVVSASKTATNKLWKIPQVPGRPTSIYLINASPGVGDEDVLLFAKGGFDLGVEQDEGFEEIDRIMKNEEYRWRIIEAAPASLPDGDGEYRIRTLNGDAIHSTTVGGRTYGGRIMGGRKMISIQNQNRGDQRAWKIKNDGNGCCTIRNILEKTYLCAEKVGGKWVPGFSKTLNDNTTWRIKPTSDFTYSICIGLILDPAKPKTKTQMSLSVDETTIILKPMKSAHNQLWRMEATDAPVTRPLTEGDDDDDDDITSKTYRIKLGKDYLLRFGCTSGLYVSINMRDSTVFGNTKDDASNVTVERNPKGGENSDVMDVYLSYTLSGQTKYLALKDTSLILDSNYYPWKIEEHPDETGHFYICDSNNKSKGILTGGSTGARITATQFKSDMNSLWEFIPA